MACTLQLVRSVCAWALCVLCMVFLLNSYILFLSAFSETDPLDDELGLLRRLAETPTVNCSVTSDEAANCWLRVSCLNDPEDRVKDAFGLHSFEHPYGRVEKFRPLCTNWNPYRARELRRDIYVANVTDYRGYIRTFFYYERGEVDLAIAELESERADVIAKWVASCTIVLCLVASLCVGLQLLRFRTQSSRLARFIVVCGVCTPGCVVRRWLRRPDVDVNAIDEVQRTTALHVAAKHGTVGAVDALLATAGVNYNCRCASGMTPLHMAALRGSADIIKRLLAAGADPNLLDNVRLTPLGYAARENNSKCLRALLDGGAACDVDGELYTPLYLAVHNRQSASTRDLFASGASLAKTLLLAIRLSDTAVIRSMLSKGADVEAHDANQSTPLFLAANIGSLKHVRMLMEHGAVHRATIDGRAPLHVAAACGHADVVAYFLQQGVDVNMTDRTGCTAAHVVGSAMLVPPVNYVTVLKLLLAEPQIDVNVHNHAGATPLLNMVQSGNVEGVRLLIAAGADCTAVCAGITAIDVAATEGHTVILGLLATLTDIVDDVAVLGLAVTAGQCDVIQLLLMLGAVPNDALMAEATRRLDALQVRHAAVLMMMRAAMHVPDPIGFTRADEADDMDDAETLASDSDDVPMVALPIDGETACLAEARKALSRMRAAMIRDRMLQILVGLVATRRLSALELMTIVDAGDLLARYMPFHLKWTMICTVLEKAKANKRNV